MSPILDGRLNPRPTGLIQELGSTKKKTGSPPEGRRLEFKFAPCRLQRLCKRHANALAQPIVPAVLPEP